MKVLTSEAQSELRDLLEKLSEHSVPIGLSNQLNYWRIELRPKRVRKKNQEKILTGMQEAVQFVVDNDPTV